MKKDFLLITLLAAIWGASFLFMRVLAPYVQSIHLANLRILIAGLVLLAVYMFGRRHVWQNLRTNYRTLLVIGVFNSGIPFSLYAFASHHIPTAYSAILNALTPIFTALVAKFYLGMHIKPRIYLGLLFGFLGVYILMYPSLKQVDVWHLAPQNQYVIYSFFACIGATLCYAIGTNYAKKHSAGMDSLLLAMGSQLLLGFAMMPVSTFFSSPKIDQLYLQPHLAISLLLLGGMCSGLAYRLFFTLLQKGGPVYASLTTFLIPLFGILWGFIFLQEHIPSTAYLSVGVILFATFLVMR